MDNNKFSETEWLGSQGDLYDKQQEEQEKIFFDKLMNNHNITKDKFLQLSSESQVYYLEKYGD